MSFAFVVFLLLVIFFPKVTFKEKILVILVYMWPFPIAIACLWLWGSGYTYTPIAVVFFLIGLWVGIKVIFWRHFGRLLKSNEKGDIFDWFFKL